MEKKIKLSEKQKEVIGLLRDGWELGCSHRMTSKIGGRKWVQKGGIGRSGETQNISLALFNSLRKNDIIVQTSSDYPTSIYSLTDLGKTIEL